MHERGILSPLFGGGTIIFFLVTAPIHIYGLVLFVRRRKLQPIKSRDPLMAVACGVVTLIWSAMETFFRSYPFLNPCWVLDLISHWLVPMIYHIYLVRSLWLMATYNHVFETLRRMDQNLPNMKPRQVSQDSEAPKCDKNSSIFFGLIPMDWNMLRQAKGRTTLVLLGALAHFILSLSFTVERIESSEGNGLCQQSIASTVWTFIVVFFYACCLCFISIKLRVVVESLKIKSELTAFSILTLVTMFTVILVTVLTRLHRLTLYAPFMVLFFQFAGTFYLCISIWWPLYLSYQMQNHQIGKDTGSANSSLSDLLATQSGHNAFAKFLAMEFSLENLLFYDDACSYRTKANLLSKELESSRNQGKILNLQAQLYNRALEVFFTYISRHSHLEINLPALIVHEISDSLYVPLDVNSEYFEDALRESAPSIDSEASIVCHVSKDEISSQSSRSHQRDRVCRNFVKPEQMTRFKHIELQNLPHVFDAAIQDVYTLMCRDSLPRFRRTNAYKELLDDFRENQATINALQVLEVL